MGGNPLLTWVLGYLLAFAILPTAGQRRRFAATDAGAKAHQPLPVSPSLVAHPPPLPRPPHAPQGNTNLRRISFVVLDEADRMLDMG